jgi:hypothetical protein
MGVKMWFFIFIFSSLANHVEILTLLQHTSIPVFILHHKIQDQTPTSSASANIVLRGDFTNQSILMVCGIL